MVFPCDLQIRQERKQFAQCLLNRPGHCKQVPAFSMSPELGGCLLTALRHTTGMARKGKKEWHKTPRILSVALATKLLQALHWFLGFSLSHFGQSVIVWHFCEETRTSRFLLFGVHILPWVIPSFQNVTQTFTHAFSLIPFAMILFYWATTLCQTLLIWFIYLKFTAVQAIVLSLFHKWEKKLRQKEKKKSLSKWTLNRQREKQDCLSSVESLKSICDHMWLGVSPQVIPYLSGACHCLKMGPSCTRLTL